MTPKRLTEIKYQGLGTKQGFKTTILLSLRKNNMKLMSILVPRALRFFWSRGRRNDILRRVALGTRMVDVYILYFHLFTFFLLIDVRMPNHVEVPLAKTRFGYNHRLPKLKIRGVRDSLCI